MTPAGTLRSASASAPVRLDFAGGWTDVPPFSTIEGGTVVAAAIDLRAHARVECGGTETRLVSEDLGVSASAWDAHARTDARLDLLNAALRRHPVGHCTLTTRAEAPAGSGLGSSGALDVALVAALTAAQDLAMLPEELAEHGCALERDEAGIAGGRQDQYIAALGGFHRFDFRDPDVHVTRLSLDAGLAAELEQSIVLCYTGVSRMSGRTISRVIAAYERGDSVVVGALRGMRDIAHQMAEALVAGDVGGVAALVSRNWVFQQSLDAGMRTGEMARLEAAAAAAGALGGKAAGSGAGGCMFFIAPGRAVEVSAAAREAGATLLPVAWSSDGVRLC